MPGLNRMLRRVAVTAGLVAACGSDGDSPSTDGSVVDASPDAADAGGGTDSSIPDGAEPDASVADAPIDAPVDAMTDAAIDAAVDALVDAPVDAPSQLALTVRVDGPGTGQIDVPGHGTCASVCTYQVASGASLTLTASATVGPLHGWWGGACDGSPLATCTVVVDQPRTARVAVGEGALLWARPLGATGTSRLQDAAAHGDTMVVAGQFSGTLTHGSTVLTTGSVPHWLVASFDGAAAAPGWATSIAVVGVARQKLVAASAAGVAATLTWTGTVDLGDGPVDSGAGLEYVAGVIAYDLAGNRRWARSASVAPSSGISIWAVATADDGAVAVAGEMWGVVTLFGQSHSVLTANANDLFVVVFNADGTTRWRRTIPNPGNDLASAVMFLPGGDVVAGGDHAATIDFGGGPRRASTGWDAFLVRLDGATGAHVWSRSIGTTDDEEIEGLARAPGGGIVLGLERGSGTSIDLGNGVVVPIAGSTGMIVGRTDEDGVTVWGRDLAGALDFAEPATPRSRVWLSPRTIAAVAAADGALVVERPLFPSGVGAPLWKLVPTDTVVFGAGTIGSSPLDADGVHIPTSQSGAFVARVGTAAP